MDINNLVVVADIHCGCAVGLLHPDGVSLDDGGTYKPSDFQLKLWSYWEEFWGEHVPKMTRGEPYAVCSLGDCVDGVHHQATTQITHNLTTQGAIAQKILEPVVQLCEGRFYSVRGTEAHVGKSGQEEERLARDLKAIPNEIGQHARYDLWKSVGPGLVHLLHHIGSTGSQAYEATAVHKELVESYIEACRWNERPPDVIVRAHRHRSIKTSIPTANGEAIAVVTPGWQGKTPFAWKIPGGRLSQPQFGGLVVRWSEQHQELFVRSKVYSLKRGPVE
jgi:hypothetical protein